jgi:hypothetical protein
MPPLWSFCAGRSDGEIEGGTCTIGKKAMQQREGKKSKLDHFLRNQDQPKENWKRSINEHESFPSESRRAKSELESIDQGARELGV